jgi:hypothetical protein
MATIHADAPGELNSEAMPEFPMLEALPLPVSTPLEPVVAVPEVIPALETAPPVEVKKVVAKVPEVKVDPFTGKIKGRKVRLRLRPDVDSRIIKELPKNELVTIIGEKGDFWAVQAPSTTEAYVFRSFVLDNVVEGSHVNVRLEPSMDAPVIAHLNSGDPVENPSISPINSKWLKIAPPADTRFYVAKEYVEYAGGPEVKVKMDQRHQTAEQLLDASAFLSRAEIKRSFEEVDFDRVAKGYHTVIEDFSEFTDLVDQAKEALASFQEEYLQKRISHIEEQANTQYSLASNATEKKAKKSLETSQHSITDKMKLWEPVEEALYLSWSSINDNKVQRDYYDEQKLIAVEIAGIVEPYTAPVKNKPGDFILRENDIPVGYVYSTQVNLQDLVGKHVRLVAAPRSNNNFAFPAYYVLSVE